MKTMLSRAWLACLLLGSSAGCTLLYGDEIDRTQCARDADCDEGAGRAGMPLQCRAHACQAIECSDDDDCPGGSVCADEICMEDAGGEPVACEKDADCDRDAGELCGFDGFCYAKWGCLEEDLEWPKAPSSFGFEAQLIGSDPTDPTTIGEVEAVACKVQDPNCDHPDVTEEEATVDDDNRLKVPFTGVAEGGFRGIVRVTSTLPEGDAVPVYAQFTAENPLVGDFVTPHPIAMFDWGSLALLPVVTGVDHDPESAGVFLRAYDCGGRPAAGVSMTSESAPDATFIPLQGEAGLVVGSNETTADGSAIIINLPPGRTMVFTLRDEGRDLLLSDTFNFIARGAALNLVLYFPRHSAVEAWMAEAERQGLTEAD